MGDTSADGSLSRQQLAELARLAGTSDRTLLEQARNDRVDIQTLVQNQRALIYRKLVEAARLHGESPPPWPKGWDPAESKDPAGTIV
jgi:hypothetical protein